MNVRKAAADPKLFRLCSRGFSTGKRQDHSLGRRCTTHSSTGAATSMHSSGGHSCFICLPFLRCYRTHEVQERAGIRISRRFFCVTWIKHRSSPSTPQENECLTVQSHSFWSVKHSRFVDVRQERAAAVSDLSSSPSSHPLPSPSLHFTPKTASSAPPFLSPSTCPASCTPRTTNSPPNGSPSLLSPPLPEHPRRSRTSFVDGTALTNDGGPPLVDEKMSPSLSHASPRRSDSESLPKRVSAPPFHPPMSIPPMESEGVLRALSHALPPKGKTKPVVTLEWEDTAPEWETALPPLPQDVSRSRRGPRTRPSVGTVLSDRIGRATGEVAALSSADAFLFPGREDLPPLTSPKPKSKFSFLAHFTDAIAERNYDVNSDVPNSVPKQKLPMWASSFTHPALDKERLCQENWISQDAVGFLSLSARETLEQWLTEWLTAAATTPSERAKNTMTEVASTPSTEAVPEVVAMMRQNIYVCPRTASFRGVFAKKSFHAGEVIFAIPLCTTTTTPTALPTVVPEKELQREPSTRSPSSFLRRLSSFFRTTGGTTTTTVATPSPPGPAALRMPSRASKDTTTCGDTTPSTTAPSGGSRRSTGVAMHTESLQASLECGVWPSVSLPPLHTSSSSSSSSLGGDGATHRLHKDGRDPPYPPLPSSSVASVLLPFSDVMEHLLSLRRSSLDPTPHVFFIEQVYLAMQLAVVLEDYEKQVEMKMTQEQRRKERGNAKEVEEEADVHLSTTAMANDATTSTPALFSFGGSFWGPYLYLLRYGVPPPSSSSFSVATSPTLRPPSLPSPLSVFDDDGIQERHRSVLEPQTFLEYSDLCLRFRHMLRGLHAKWWSYYDANVLPEVLSRVPAASSSSSSFSIPVSFLSPPSLETLEWAFRVTLSRQRLLPQQRCAVSSFRECEQYAMKMDTEETHGRFGEMVMRMKWWVCDSLLGIVDRPRLMSNAIPDPTIMPAILPLVDLLQHATGGTANTTMSLEEGEAPFHPQSLASPPCSSSTTTPQTLSSSSSHFHPLYAVIRASEAIEEDEELTTLYSKCYSVAYTLYRYGALALHNRKEDVHHVIEKSGIGEKKAKQENEEGK